MTPRLYVAGPASGYPDHNRPAFEAAALELSLAGFEAVNPLRLGADQQGWHWEHYLHRALREMLTCHGVAMLEGWTGSRGATLEVGLAQRLGMEAFPVEHWLELGAEGALKYVSTATAAAAGWEVS